MPDPAELEAPGSIEAKGKGAIETWFLVGLAGRPSVQARAVTVAR